MSRLFCAGAIWAPSTGVALERGQASPADGLDALCVAGLAGGVAAAGIEADHMSGWRTPVESSK